MYPWLLSQGSREQESKDLGASEVPTGSALGPRWVLCGWLGAGQVTGWTQQALLVFPWTVHLKTLCTCRAPGSWNTPMRPEEQCGEKAGERQSAGHSTSCPDSWEGGPGTQWTLSRQKCRQYHRPPHILLHGRTLTSRPPASSARPESALPLRI